MGPFWVGVREGNMVTWRCRFSDLVRSGLSPIRGIRLPCLSEGGDAGISGVELPGEWSLQLLQALEWKRFEELGAAYFEMKGHAVQMTGLGADGGVDCYLYGRGGGVSKPLGAVQCKARRSSRIGVRPVRELLGIMTDVGCPLGIFITTTTYTAEAEQFAVGKHIQLLVGNRFLSLIQSLPADEQGELLARATAGDHWTPSSPRCGTKLILRTARRGKRVGSQFWGCKNYPGCRYTMQVGAA